MGLTHRFRIGSLMASLLGAAVLPGCILEYDDEYYAPAPPPPAPPPAALVYETCFSTAQCEVASFCAELAVPAYDHGYYVNAICTLDCFDDLDCPVSPFNFFQGACIDEYLVGGPIGPRLCVERCEIDADCDQLGGFACQVLDGERLCLPIR